VQPRLDEGEISLRGDLEQARVSLDDADPAAPRLHERCTVRRVHRILTGVDGESLVDITVIEGEAKPEPVTVPADEPAADSDDATED